MDLSSYSKPAVPPYSLGLAQLEELNSAIASLRQKRGETFTLVAWTDTFSSQLHYLLATAFDEVYLQPCGMVPLVGLGSTVPFFGKLLQFLKIDIHAEAREKYKSFVQPYISDAFTPEQRQNHEDLMHDLETNAVAMLAENRFGGDTVAATNSLDLGPYSSGQAETQRLIDGQLYKSDVFQRFENAPKRSFYDYFVLKLKEAQKESRNVAHIGLVHVNGSIGETTGELSTQSIVKGLHQAGQDPRMMAIVLRIDSGGGDVVDSETIWRAVRDVQQQYGKSVVASFGNAAASGGYLIATSADAIFALPSTLTGSIGVAALRPSFSPAFFDQFKVSLEEFGTRSKALSLTHPLEGRELERYRAQIDEMYASFKDKVCQGRHISPDVIESVAGGRVYSAGKIYEMVGYTPKRERAVGLPDAKLQPVELEEDQDMSPYAAVGGGGDLAGVLRLSEQVGANTVGQFAAEQTGIQTLDPNPPAVGFVSDSSLSPYGRGLVDAIGTLKDAAMHAFVLFMVDGIRQLREINPDISDERAAQLLMPDCDITIEDGEVTLDLDVRLHRFPTSPSFWDQLFKNNLYDPIFLQRVLYGALKDSFKTKPAVSFKAQDNSGKWI